MGTIEEYRAIIRRLIEDYAQYKPANGEIDTEIVIDAERDHYEVGHLGWDGPRRIHGAIVHIDIIGEYIWIQYDGTSRSVAEELLAAGIPKEKIVLGFYPRHERQYTDFAIG